MFDQPNPNLPGGEPEDMLSPVEAGAKPQRALEAGRLRPAPYRAEGSGTGPAAPTGGPEEVEVRAPLLNRRNVVIIGVAVLVVIVVVVVILLIRGSGQKVPLSPTGGLEPAETPSPPPAGGPAPAQLEIPILVEPTAPPPPPPVVEVPITPPDSDGDGLADADEAQSGTNPVVADTDGDSLSDYDEVRVWQTNPLNPDTDGDSYLDGQEVQGGFNPNGPGKLLVVPPQS